MDAPGSLIITYNTGWACTNDCTHSMEFERLPDGRALGTMFFYPKKVFECVGALNKDMPVKGCFLGYDGVKIAFNAVVEGKGRIRVIGEVNNNFTTIIKEAKLWQKDY